MVLPDLPADYPVRLDELSADSLCGFEFERAPRVRAGLMERSHGVSLGDVREQLAIGEFGGPLGQIVRTGFERDALLKAYCQFVAASQRSLRLGRAESPRLAWIVPDAMLTPMAHLDRGLVGNREVTDLLGRLGEHYRVWLPWVSLAITNHLRRWRGPRLRTLHRAIFRLSAGSGSVYPWEAEYPLSQRFLPMQVLYRHEPSRQVSEVIAALTALGLSSINDLKCSHPEAVAASKAADRPLFALHRLLKRH